MPLNSQEGRIKKKYLLEVLPINSHRYKLLVLDIDGTLVNKHSEISEADCSAIREASKAGIQVSLCTGRANIACTKVLTRLSLPGYHIFYDGALIYDDMDQTELFSQPISPDVVKEACLSAMTDKIPLDLFSSTHNYVMEKSWVTDIRREYFGVESIVTDFNTLWQMEKILKGTIVIKAADSARTQNYISKFEKILRFSWSVTPAYPGCHFINVIDPCVSKGKAVESLAAHYGVELSQVAAIGDGANDFSLLSTAGLAVAMDNSPDELKSLADCVTADVEHNGVAQAIHKYLL